MYIKTYEDPRIIIIAAKNKKGFIGLNGDLIEHNKEDIKFFKNKTKGHIVIMGRKTFESINSKPLKNRINIVISSKISKKEAIEKGIYVCKNIEDSIILSNLLIKEFKHLDDFRRDIFFIGGENIYREALPYTDEIILNVFKNNDIEGDTIFPEIPKDLFILKYRKYCFDDFVQYNYKSRNLIK